MAVNGNRLVPLLRVHSYLFAERVKGSLSIDTRLLANNSKSLAYILLFSRARVFRCLVSLAASLASVLQS